MPSLGVPLLVKIPYPLFRAFHCKLIRRVTKPPKQINTTNPYKLVCQIHTGNPL